MRVSGKNTLINSDSHSTMLCLAQDEVFDL